MFHWQSFRKHQTIELLTVSISMEKDAYHLESYHWTNIQRFHTKWDMKDQKLEYLVVYNQIYKENYNRKGTVTRCASGSVCLRDKSREIAIQRLNEWTGLWMENYPLSHPAHPQSSALSHPGIRYNRSTATDLERAPLPKNIHTIPPINQVSNSNLLQQSKTQALRQKTQSTRWNILLRTPEDRNTALLIKNTGMLD